MKEISFQMATYLFAGNQTEVYLLYDDGSECLVQYLEDIKTHHTLNGIFGVED